jgi:fermentation-respiration switch protein FrsA (DUF1100 family)
MHTTGESMNPIEQSSNMGFAGQLLRYGLPVLAALLSGCTHLFFYPQETLVDSPDRYGIKYQAENFKAADGTSLNAWFFPAQDKAGNKDVGNAKATVLFLHGNAQNISTHFRTIAWLPAEGYNVLALDYRGYGASGGSPDLAGMQLDIDAAMRRLLVHEGVDPNRIVIFGQSLGGALAIHYAAHSHFRANLRAVVIDSSFYDYRQVAREKLAGSVLTWPFQWLPWVAINNDYSPADSIAALSPIPLLLIHNEIDGVVPSHHSRQLFERAGEPREMWIVPGAGHTQSMGSQAMRDKLAEFLRRNTD